MHIIVSEISGVNPVFLQNTPIIFVYLFLIHYTYFQHKAHLVAFLLSCSLLRSPLPGAWFSMPFQVPRLLSVLVIQLTFSCAFGIFIKMYCGFIRTTDP